MDEMNFGDVLRQARERSGEDLVSVARRIRIRPDILERIEESDIDAMPPRGYSRNMINAYARYLGLNTTEVVKMYQNAQYRRQVEQARENIKPTGFEMPSTRREGMRSGHDDVRPQNTGAATRGTFDTQNVSARRRSSGGFDNALFDDIEAAPAQSSEKTTRIGAVHVGSHNGYGQGLSQRNAAREIEGTRRMDPIKAPRRSEPQSARGSQGSHRGRRSSTPGEHYANLYAGPKGVGGAASPWRDKLPFVVAGIIVLLLVVAITVGINALGRSQQNDQASAPLNVTGLPGSEAATEGDGAAGEQNAEQPDAAADAAAEEKADEPEKKAAPTKTVMAFDIPKGTSTYYEVYLDGKYVEGGDVTGPKSGTFDVEGTFEFRVTPPEDVTLTQDGTEIPLEAGASGVANVEVDFADVLAEYNGEGASGEEDEPATSGSRASAANEGGSSSGASASAASDDDSGTSGTSASA